MTSLKFVIWAYSFDDRSGGVIALHLLCERLNELGHTAYVWETGRPSLRARPNIGEYVRALRYEVGRTKRLYSSGPFRNPRAKRKDLEDAIVVYPEVVEGNPLGSSAVVRWFLHRPGHHTGRYTAGDNDLCFFYMDSFNDPRLSIDPSNKLTLSWINEAYAQVNTGERVGSACLFRKGKERNPYPPAAGATIVDGMGHEEKARVFNERKHFFSYDLYTFYNVYAAICGCIPVIVPDPAISKEQWLPRIEDRYGLAYGIEETDWAVATRRLLLQRLRDVRAEEDRMLQSFVQKCRAKFGTGGL